nr:carbon storage regulator [Lysobacter antibioticus]
MLVLTRRPGQMVMIGHDVEVRLLKPRRDGEVRMGISAPNDVRVVREELLHRPRRRPAT